MTLQWQSEIGRPYQVESSSNLTVWATLATNLTATGTNFTFSTNQPAVRQYFRVYYSP